MAHCYSHLYGLPTTGLRFFTVYGPWGRPDMALFLFTKAILEGRPIEVFNQGRMRRDFTYIDDIVEGVVRASARIAAPQPAVGRRAPRSGTSNGALSALQHRQQPAGRADARHRHARGGAGQEGDSWSCCRCSRATCRRPTPTWTTWPATSASSRRRRSRIGIRRFVAWYRDYYKV